MTIRPDLPSPDRVPGSAASVEPRVGVVNVISGPPELGDWIRGAFAATLGTLSGVTGVREFYLRRAVSAELTRCLYLSITVWDSIGDFDRWQASADFRAAHPDRGENREQFAQLRSVRLRPDLPVFATTTVADLDTAIIARLRAEHHGLIPAADCGFVSQLHWETAQFPNFGYRPPNRFAPSAVTGAPS